MKKKLVLKPFVLPTLYILMVIGLMIMSTTIIYKDDLDQNLTYVSDSIFDNTIPVINDTEVIFLNPYTSDKVSIGVDFYNYLEEESKQEKAIVEYDNMYLQNSGITYISEEKFDIISILDGTVTKVYNNDLLGNIVEITHENDIVSTYQMLEEVVVKENQKVTRGEVIAKSGASKLSSSPFNLHFELMKEGTIVNPNQYFGKNIKEI